MFETTRTNLIQWNQRTSERVKLQHSYLALLMVIIFLAGLISLFNASRSRQLMYVALVLIVTYVTNFLIWGLLQTFIIAKLPRSNRSSTRNVANNRRSRS